MPNMNETECVARKIMPIIYILDTSGSMAGSRISSVNEAMRESVEVLKDVAADNTNVELVIGVLHFASNAKWVFADRGFLYPDDFYWNDLTAGGLTAVGAALDELDKKLSRKTWLNNPVGYKVPVLIFMSDGDPTDDYKKSLDRLNATNKWFKAAPKIAIAVEGANKEMLANIVGNAEAVIEVHNNETLKKLIKAVSVTSAGIGSKSRTVDNTQTEILQAVKGEFKKEEQKKHIVIADPVLTPQQVGGKGGVQDDQNDDEWDDEDWS